MVFQPGGGPDAGIRSFTESIDSADRIPRWTQAIKPWADELEKRSGGRIRVEPYFAESLGKQADAYQSVQTGLADMTEMLFTSGAGAFPLFRVLFHGGPAGADAC